MPCVCRAEWIKRVVLHREDPQRMANLQWEDVRTFLLLCDMLIVRFGLLGAEHLVWHTAICAVPGSHLGW